MNNSPSTLKEPELFCKDAWTFYEFYFVSRCSKLQAKMFDYSFDSYIFQSSDFLCVCVCGT